MELRRVRGYLLIITILAAGALMFLSVVVLRFVHDRNQMTARLEREWVAEAAALAGLERARFALSKDNRWNAGLEGDEPNSRGHYAITFSRTAMSGFSTSNVGGDKPVRGYDERVVPPGFVHLVSTGTSAGATFVTEALVCVQGELLIDTFDDAAAVPPKGWTQWLGSNFQMGGGAYTLGASDHHVTCAGSDGWTDVRLEVRACDYVHVRQMPDQGVFTVFARMQTPTETDPSRWSEWPGISWSYDPKSDTFTLAQSLDGYAPTKTPAVRIARANTPLGRLPPHWYLENHTYFIEVEGSRVRCGLDDVTLCSAPAHAAKTSGHIGIWTGPKAIWQVDSVRVINLSGAQYTARW